MAAGRGITRAMATRNERGTKVKLELTPSYWHLLTSNLAAAPEAVTIGNPSVDKMAEQIRKEVEAIAAQAFALHARIIACTMRHFRVCEKLVTEHRALSVVVFVPRDATITSLLERAQRCTDELNSFEHAFLKAPY
jgi:hypothetical protein